MTCTNLQCNNVKNINVPLMKCIVLQTTILHALEEGGKILVAKKSKTEFKPVPCWNDYVKESHCDARKAFCMWQSQGNPHFGPVCEL